MFNFSVNANRVKIFSETVWSCCVNIIGANRPRVRTIFFCFFSIIFTFFSYHFCSLIWSSDRFVSNVAQLFRVNLESKVFFNREQISVKSSFPLVTHFFSALPYAGQPCHHHLLLWIFSEKFLWESSKLFGCVDAMCLSIDRWKNPRK